MKLTRRQAVAGAAALSLAPHAVAQATSPEPDIWLWPDGPPGHPPAAVKPDDKYHVDRPGLFVFRPEQPNGGAILMFQGGGYQLVGRGPGVPRYFASRGYTVFDMRYRLPHARWEAGPDVMLQDAQRGMRIIRSRADEFGVRRDKVGVMGFSSGGHMAAFAATAWAREMAPAETGLLDISPRPDFACLGCPVVTMTGPYVHGPSRKSMFGDVSDEAEWALRSPDRLVSRETPPAFMVHAADDRVVPVQNSVALFRSLRAAGVVAQMHLFETGGHNMGAGFTPGSPLSPFPQLMLAWMGRQGFPPNPTKEPGDG